jgi:integrase
MATIVKCQNAEGKPYYTVPIRLKGYPEQIATFSRIMDAKTWAASTETAIKEGRHFKTVESKKHTFADLADRYIKDVLPGKPKQEVRQKMQMEWWKEKMVVYSLADVSPVRYLAALFHAFTIAVKEWGWLDDSPTRKVKKPTEARGRVQFLDDDERQRLLKACQESRDKQLYLCVILALSSGMRQAELMGLKWQNVNLKDGFIILHETKNGNRLRVPLSGLGLSLLQEHSKIRRLDTSLLFPGIIHINTPLNLRSAFVVASMNANIFGEL